VKKFEGTGTLRGPRGSWEDNVNAGKFVKASTGIW